MKFRTVPDRAGRKARKRMLRDTLPAVAADLLTLRTETGGQAQLPVVYADCRRRPDVADLERAHRFARWLEGAV